MPLAEFAGGIGFSAVFFGRYSRSSIVGPRGTLVKARRVRESRQVPWHNPVDRVFSRKRWIAVLVAYAGLFVPALAQADGRTPDARALGVAEAILDYCTRAYPSSTEKFQFQVARLTRGASLATLTKVRASDEYLRARGAEEDFVGKVDAHNAKRICAKSLAARK